MTLHQFIHMNRDAILARTTHRLDGRGVQSAGPHEIEHGVGLFLTQVVETLRLERSDNPFPTSAIGAAAARHGRDLLRGGYTISQVVHAYGDICQAITEIALDQKATITVKEFHTFNRCLDTAIAHAVTEFTRVPNFSIHGRGNADH